MYKIEKICIRFLIVFVFLLTGSTIGEGTAHAVNVGTPFLIGTSTYGDMSTDAAFDGTNYLVGMEEGANPSEDTDTQTAQFISQSGTLVGSRIYNGPGGGMPHIGFNGTNYLMAWPTDDNKIYGQLISTSGTIVKSPFAISTTIGHMRIGTHPICDSTKCTVIWFDSDSYGTVYGRDISPSGSFLTDEYTLFSNPSPYTGGVSTGAACDSNGNCLIAVDTSAQILALIKGLTINKSSFVIATKTAPVTCQKYNPVSIAFDGTNYLVVWSDHGDCAAVTAWDVLAQRIDTSGNLVGSAFQVNSASTWRAAFPFIAFDGNNYLVTWTDSRNDANKNGVCDPGEGTCDDIYGQLVSKSGALSGSEFIINNDVGNQLGLVTGFNNGKYLVLVNTGTSRVSAGALSGGSVYGVFLNTDSSLYGSFTGAGIWKWDGSSFTQTTPNNPLLMVISGSNLYGSFAGGGIWKWDGSTWSQVTPNNPQAMVILGSNLYGSFVGGGIWKCDGTTWTQVTPNSPDLMATTSTTLYGSFAGGGIWKWDESSWSQVTPNNPQLLVASGSNLYGSFAGGGIWKWNGTTWTQTTPNNPQQMVASDSNLYGSFAGGGIWQWDGSTWSQVTPNNPASMVLGN